MQKRMKALVRHTLNKRASAAISTAIKVITSIVVGGAVLIGGYGIVNGFIETAREKTCLYLDDMDQFMDSGSWSEEVIFPSQDPSTVQTFGNFSAGAYTATTSEAWGRRVYHDSTGRYGDFILTLGAGKNLGVQDNSTYDLGDRFEFSFVAMYQTSVAGDYMSGVQVGDLKIVLMKSSTSNTDVVPSVTYQNENIWAESEMTAFEGVAIDGADGERGYIAGATSPDNLNPSNMPTRRVNVHVKYENSVLKVSFSTKDGMRMYRCYAPEYDFSNVTVGMYAGNISDRYQSAAIGKFTGIVN